MTKTFVFAEQEWKGPIDSAESHLREIVTHGDGPKEIYALLSEGGWGGVGQRFILIFDNQAVLRCEDGNGRERERDLSTAELDELKSWISAHDIDRLKEFDEGTADGIQYEYFHLQADGHEHRVFMNNPPRAPIGAGAVFFGGKAAPNRKLYGELTQRMLKLDKAPMRVIYPDLEKIPGFRVIVAKETAEIAGISYRDGQLLAGVVRSYEKPMELHRVIESGLAKDFLLEKKQPYAVQQPEKGVDVHEGPLANARLQAEFADLNGRKDGLWALRKGRKGELIAEGMFGRPVLCSSGEWIVAAKTPPGQMWNVPNGVVRIHLPDKKIFDVDLPPADNFNPVAWIEARKRVLLYQQRDFQDWKAGPEKPEFYLLDPVTGATARVEGEMRPFFDAGEYELQPTGKPNEFWAALHSSVVDPRLRTTTIGRFDSNNFQFTPALAFPDIHFKSSSFFVDQAAKTIWLAINGDLIRLALPN